MAAGPIRRSVLHIQVGNLLELAGAAVGCYAVAVLAGVGWALLAAGAVCVVGAELVYDGSVLSVPLPRRPRLAVRARRLRRRVSAWRHIRAARRRLRKAGLHDPVAAS